MSKFVAWLSWSVIIIVCAAALSAGAEQGVMVSGTIKIMRKNVNTKVDNANAVVWLKASSSVQNRPPAEPGLPPIAHFKIVQEHKRFEPHVLAIPVGSVVDFPNRDPFLHNVFSMFNGKRFDLGLYEAGTSHHVNFDAAGVCYIFCNIHPEMSAAVVVIDSPYFTITNHAGEFSIPNVAPGTYFLNVWHERGKPERPDEYPYQVTISTGNSLLPAIRLVDAGELLANHKNKHGHEYDAPPAYR